MPTIELVQTGPSLVLKFLKMVGTRTPFVKKKKLKTEPL